MISIIIPCFNDHDVLPRAVASALNQRYADKEVIVVDDGSEEPVAHYEGTRLIRHEHNCGLSAALNTGIEYSNGDRFVILASDDELHKDHLALTSRVDRDIVSVDMLAGGKPVKAKPGTLDALQQGNCHSYAALIKKWVWRATGGFKETMNPSWEDYEFFLNSAKVGAKWGHVHKPLHIYHRNPVGRDAHAQGKETLLWGKLMGYHQDLYGLGRGVVTFVVPCYKHEQFVAGAVQSALDQVYPHVRVVVVDDGSPGDVANAIEEVTDGRVVLIRQENKHLSGARNTGIYYALQEFGSEYLVMLDADDEVHPEYIEATMAAMLGKEYVYTDVKFIGDAHHSLPMEEYDCNLLMKQHLHPCTFLQPSRMWEDIVEARGYGYDEAMKEGYEDWEYALAGVEAGWCGKRVPGEYFYYRYHDGGSMRTEAKKISGKLGSYLREQHPWMRSKEQVTEMCSTCGGRGKFTVSQVKGGISSVLIPGVGEVSPLEMLEVEYTGSKMSTIKKQGAGGQIYKYSGDPEKQKRGYGPRFTIYARDAHLFRGPFRMRRLQPHKVEGQQPTPEPVRRVEVVHVEREQPAPPPKQKLETMPVAEALELTEAGKEYKPDDFTRIKGIGPASAKKLVAAGFTLYDDVADAAEGELSSVLGVGLSRARTIKRIADQLADEMAVAE